jgi:hypothetical protein
MCGYDDESAGAPVANDPPTLKRSRMPERNACGRCGQPLRSRERISVANVGLRCYPCFNEETAALMGVAFDNTPLQPVTVRDVGGVEHTFDF